MWSLFLGAPIVRAQQLSATVVCNCSYVYTLHLTASCLKKEKSLATNMKLQLIDKHICTSGRSIGALDVECLFVKQPPSAQTFTIQKKHEIDLVIYIYYIALYMLYNWSPR